MAYLRESDFETLDGKEGKKRKPVAGTFSLHLPLQDSRQLGLSPGPFQREGYFPSFKEIRRTTIRRHGNGSCQPRNRCIANRDIGVIPRQLPSESKRARAPARQANALRRDEFGTQTLRALR
jgi:hypothetical protein